MAIPAHIEQLSLESIDQPFENQTPSELPARDNTESGLRALLAANQAYRNQPWPSPYDVTSHGHHLMMLPATSYILVTHETSHGSQMSRYNWL
jgi:hypothetical protein